MALFHRSLGVCVALIAACSLSAAPVGAQQYPLEIEHALGITVLPKKPERIATVAWANHEVPLALGVVPVGFAAANFGDDNGNGLLPWVEARLEELGAAPPALFDEGDGIDFEAVAERQPDVILAAYSGISQSDYDTLSQIAPVVAYTEGPWATGWRDMIRINSEGMGMAAEGQALIERLEAKIADTAANHSDLAGKTAMFVTHLDPTNLGRISFYTDNDARVRFFHDLGLTSPEVVKQNSTPGKFAGEISSELIDELDDVDILVTYGGQPLIDQLSAHPLTSRLPVVENGAVVLLGNSPLGTAANPTPMSISWLLDDYADLLSEAARKSE
ncbi:MULTISPECIES: iron-siderophore ABC transporter substrate-binding protein [unclassified Halomonas]|uniref:iron-siderophore ABC transporter substrate-binding protein n=1 Tax=unclassified Halomonas TaxID=2609666 RepID=UPI0007D92496|nr:MULTISPECIES: iron-siderophore ABC transporter substrate-binding protein [unclassified Halomonas]MBT2787754.1 iron-siderophore ABC transporter substrate-binding protein [Halomonas sp. ISL-106]MBT2799635.1 iron-siderophore ABC transporter substrate-binding protein [Halomonas sp. ISL-104]OAL61406.1 ABC transporter substrate-binding protein [Halomonas sp. ALS9]